MNLAYIIEPYQESWVVVQLFKTLVKKKEKRNMSPFIQIHPLHFKGVVHDMAWHVQAKISPGIVVMSSVPINLYAY